MRAWSRAIQGDVEGWQLELSNNVIRLCNNVIRGRRGRCAVRRVKSSLQNFATDWSVCHDEDVRMPQAKGVVMGEGGVTMLSRGAGVKQ